MIMKESCIRIRIIQGLRPSCFGEQIIDRLDRTEPIEHCTEGERSQDDPHEHAGDTERLGAPSSRTPVGASSAVSDDGGQERGDAPMAELSTSLVQPLTKGTIIDGENRQRQHARRAAGAAFRPSGRVSAFLPASGQDREFGCNPAADRDVENEHPGHHQARDRRRRARADRPAGGRSSHRAPAPPTAAPGCRATSRPGSHRSPCACRSRA